ncbi:radical SAM family heme chaperone HemW [Cyclobacterium marinum]|uniref:Heme chaperone HemW n=1 Tax=Cyclobacterium marinum (strain ATCC 25205 / DSM 745 / LMG 13164 / NCIMB 1802) TaxID=880070 RepID=G0IX09_CYCMS|nr:radical SAM family heme chaperone HemW [Cyclobacterium marinum]AEL24927.1 oxygen-independent coproporphyrinogen III oxidase [Cyclobacterium marinum DSM 745]
MSGIYIHIPFCLQACTYCDFHFSTNRSNQNEMVDMICSELTLRKNYLNNKGPIETIYFGGGTPSILSIPQLKKIWDTITNNFDCEIQEATLEANPDDLDEHTLAEMLALGIDRLSLGIQSFHDSVLQFYNRSHNAKESLEIIRKARKAGFKTLSMDLIYGFPYQDHSLWEKDLAATLEQGPDHISSYCLTVEPKTALGVWEKKGRFKEASEDFQAEQFEILQKTLNQAGYIQYEISNFAKENAFSLHNSNYWKGIPYLGVGPGAHSFDGEHRGHNINHNGKYIKLIENGKLPFKADYLSPEDRINEYLLTSLRTMWGINSLYLKNHLNYELLTEKAEEIKLFQEQKMLQINGKNITLSDKGKLLADYIASKLFI